MSGVRKPITFEVDSYGCHNCTSHAKDIHGYPHVSKYNKGNHLHRVLYEEAFGKLEKGLVVRHKCDNRACINIEHLESGTHKENMEDCKNRNRLNTPRGETRSDAKLTRQQVLEIRERNDLSQYKLAELYCVNQSTISNIKSGKRRVYD